MMQSLITQKVVFEDPSTSSPRRGSNSYRTQSFDSDKPVVILNPTQYTIQDEEEGNPTYQGITSLNYREESIVEENH